MGTRRLGLALFVALVVSLGITAVFYVRVTRLQAVNRPKTRRIVAAAATLQPGTVITADNVTEVDWPENVSIEGLIEKKEDVTGRVLIYAAGDHQPLMRRDLASGGSFGLAAKIPDGMRATAVKTNEVSSVAGFVFPGSRVDVLVTLRSGNNNESTVTRTALQNVQVLSTGTKIEPDPNGKPENINVVTLLVTPEQSEKLALAESQGTLHFVLRNGGDSATPDTRAVDMAELTGAPQKLAEKLPPTVRTVKPPIAAVKLPEPAKPEAPKQPELYTVETLANGKITIAKFPAVPE